MSSTKRKRILLKISGESMKGDKPFGIDEAAIKYLAKQIALAHKGGCEVAIVLGGGNFVRGQDYEREGMDRASADYAGMMATIINGLVLQNAVLQLGIDIRAQSAITVNRVAEPFVTRRAIGHMAKDRIVVFVAGTGNPFMSTDTAAALRALEIKADALLIAKNGVDGIFDSDPKVNKLAKHIPSITPQMFLNMKLKVMDSTAVTLCMENRLPMTVFDIFKEGNLAAILEGKRVGTEVVLNP